MARKPASKSDTTDAAPKTESEPKAGASNRNKRLVAGAAIGIGSAALVAALLYANRARKADKS